MPQMNPMWWFSLFLMFIMILILTNSLNYFFSKIQIKKAPKNKMNKKYLNWKW